MKANEFVKKFGIDEASEIVVGIPDKFKFKCLSNTCWDTNTYKYSDRFKPRNSLVNIADLKRLVESHELVEAGLPELKKTMFSDSTDFEYVKNWILTVSEKLLTEKGIKLKQAILDVESCQ